ncbi:acyltransferase family protein [Bacillus sp. T33-2]|uniref:acyltransferase family protein n=1 Tax=Bacillus sp. T33-2 TaxID=2054168 RepID=UPI000C78ED82|nr:acyltransferase [Bacillus sp. T33-2]PLR90765.1 hypothetical protein CVD19_22295 [Bacillus sp. T33-2]
MKRYHELDSLRGLAALSVVMSHCLISFPVFLSAVAHESIDHPTVKFLANSPIHIFWAGHEAVILFFVLSGYVLSLQFLNHQYTKYSIYVTRRFFRIYVPYITSILVSMFLFTALEENDSDALSSWFNSMWSIPFDLKQAISFLLLLGFDTHNINTVTWSLVHELRISLIFPLVMVVVLKYNWFKSFLYGFMITITTWYIMSFISWHLTNQNISLMIQSFSYTAYYSLFFILGAIFAKYRHVIAHYFKCFGIITKSLLIILALLLYINEWILPHIGYIKLYGTLSAKLISTFVIDFLISIGVLVLFTFSLNWAPFTKVLTNRVFIYLGKISYSVYLVHPIILLFFVYATKNILPLNSLIFFVLLLSLSVASLMYKYVEKPSISLGRWMTKHRVTKSNTVIK